MNKKAPIRLQVAIFSLYRMFNFAGIRLVFPYLTLISQGLGASVETISIAVSISSFASVLAPFFAQIGERFGRRAGMLSGMMILVLAGAIIHGTQHIAGFFIGMLLLQLATNVFSPAMQAYISESIPFEKRGMALSITELGWPLSYLLIVPLIGFVIEAWGWSVFYLMLSGITLLFMAIILLRVEKHTGTSIIHSQFQFPFREIFHSANAVWGLTLGFCLIGGNIVVQLVFGVWLEKAFQASIAQLGLVSSLIGAAELSGILLSAMVIDRIGKRRVIGLGVAFCAGIPALGSILSLNLTSAGALLVVFFFFSELTIVSALTLVSELYPEARNTYMAMYGVTNAIGFGTGSILAPLAFRTGIRGNFLFALLLYALAGFCLLMIKLPLLKTAQTSAETIV